MHDAFTWEDHRRKDGTLCLLIDEIEEMVRFRHPEAASIALMNALRLVRGE